MKDVRVLYKNIIKDQKQALGSGILSGMSMAARIILDTKYFVKEYPGEISTKVEMGCLEGKLKLYCTVSLRNNDQLNEGLMIKGANPMPVLPLPYECITLKSNATFEELKLEVERSFREVYWGLRNFVVESIVNVNAKEHDLVFGLVEVGRRIVFEGRNKLDRGVIGNELENNGLIKEYNKNVDCLCGTQDNDGERMVCCDICEVWQHTRCVRIPNSEEVPHIFLCTRCEQEIMILPSLP